MHFYFETSRSALPVTAPTNRGEIMEPDRELGNIDRHWCSKRSKCLEGRGCDAHPIPELFISTHSLLQDKWTPPQGMTSDIQESPSFVYFILILFLHAAQGPRPPWAMFAHYRWNSLSFFGASQRRAGAGRGCRDGLCHHPNPAEPLVCQYFYKYFYRFQPREVWASNKQRLEQTVELLMNELYGTLEGPQNNSCVESSYKSC